MGDVVLREVSKLLKSECRQGDFIARFGGEEFVVLLQYCDAEDALNWADHVREKLEMSRPAGLRVTASFGVASAEDKADRDFGQLFSAADKAVYAAKSTGRNRVALEKAA